MTDVTEHHGEQEGKGDNGKQAGINFLVGRDSVTVHDTLESFRKFVCPVESGRRLVGAELM
jgi:hypothetical protein